MFSKTALLAFSILLGSITASSAEDDWRTKYPQITMATSTNENETDQATRYKPVIDYLEKKLRVKVVARRAGDYAGIVEALRSNRIELARVGPAAYAQAWIVTKGQVEPLAAEIDENGGVGYYSVVIVKADSEFKKLDDLKGKSFAFADPASASGYQVPQYFLKEDGRDPESFFGKTSFSGSHENTVMGVMSGTYDGGATWYTDETRSNMARMESKKMIEPGQWRVLWKSPRIPTSPWVVPSNLPDAMKMDIKAALIDMASEDPVAWTSLSGGTKTKGLAPIGHVEYEPMIKLTQENLRARKAP